MTRPLRVGITIGLHAEDESRWTNGIKQNALFLAEALRACPNVASVMLVNTTATRISRALPWDLERWPTAPLAQAKDDIDVLIELGGQVDAALTRHLHARGAKLVSYCCGAEYVHAVEAILFERPQWPGGLFVNRDYDDIWMVPQVAGTSAAYFTTLRRRPARVVPFVWDPVFLEQRAAPFPGRGLYSPQPGPRRITVLEPNRDVVKFCLYPALIADLAYRRRRDAIGSLRIQNSSHLAAHSPEFASLMKRLDLVLDGKATFEGSAPTPDVLAHCTDIVVSHQWGNPLNYVYLESCWQGFPLVHNAPLCADLGYHYAGNDIDAGCAQLLEAIAVHDRGHEAYRNRQRERIARFLPRDAVLTREYTALLESVVQR